MSMAATPVDESQGIGHAGGKGKGVKQPSTATLVMLDATSTLGIDHVPTTGQSLNGPSFSSDITKDSYDDGEEDMADAVEKGGKKMWV